MKRLILCFKQDAGERRDLNTEHSRARRNDDHASRALPVAWDGGESFSLSLTPRQVGARLLAWNQHAQWISPLLPANNGSLNFSADK
jgi:hypothetical protein